MTTFPKLILTKMTMTTLTTFLAEKCGYSKLFRIFATEIETIT